MRWAAIVLIALTTCRAAQGQPLLTAYRAETPPQIDGDLHDPCWQAASIASPFILATGDALAEEQTRVRACWDDANLYLGFEVDESYLDPRLNMLDLVKAEHADRDTPVYNDECVEIFLEPPGESYYHFAVNSEGALYDARDQGEPWDGDVRTAARRGTTSYVVEVAIGLESMEAAPEGRWRANFARERTAVQELSTWSGLQGSFHQPAKFGELRFAQAGPAVTAAAVSRKGEQVMARAEVTGAGQPRLVGTVRAGDATAERSGEGVGTQELTITVPPQARRTGRMSASWALLDGDTAVQRSAELPMAFGLGQAELALNATDVEVSVWLSGEAIDAGEGDLDLNRGLNVVAIHARRAGEEPALSPAVTSAERPVPVVWLRRADAPPEGWRQEIDRDGWELIASAQLWRPGAEEVYAACGLYVGERGPQMFPKLTTFHLPRGSAQLMRVYVHAPVDVPSDDYRMVVEAPAELEYRALEVIGGTPPEVSSEPAEEAGGVEMARHLLSYGTAPAAGMDLSIRWGDENGASLGYQPALTSGGTHDWRHLSATITAPEGAASAHPLIIKWQNRSITGTFWVDNVVFREAGSDENLLKMGTFDEPAWEPTYKIKPEGPDGSNCVKLVSTQRDADRQQAIWVDGEDVVPVEPGEQYVVAMDVKCERLVSATAKPLCGLLFAAPEAMPEGELPVLTYFQSLGGAITEIPHRSSTTILPPLKDVRPHRARITPCYYSSRLTNDEVGRAYAESCWQSGITWTYGKYANNVVSVLAPRGHQVILSIGWHGWNAISEEMRAHLEAHPELQAMDFEGQPQRHTYCPTWFLSDEARPAREMLQRWLLDAVNSHPYAGANWDLEQPVVDPPTFCTCERCIAEFRRVAGIGEDVEITPQTLLEEHRDAWVDFRCSQNAEMAGLLRDMLQKAERPIEFSLYSGFQSARTREHYGVDWAKMRPHLDVGIAGYGGSAESVAATVEALGDVPLIGGEMWYLSHRDDARPAPRMEIWRNRLLRKYVESGCHGVLIWQLASMDGGAFYATSEASAIIAEYEDWFRHEQRCDERVTVEGLPNRDWAAFERNGQVLVLLMNFRDEPVQTTVTVDGQANVREMEACGTDVFIVP
ncbi:MAG: carbohydrate-binding family 9-like protein [Armatimonadota bacterium]|nr:carbohydrate-binding family 9-like protein [Armatimonadota bacterium]